MKISFIQHQSNICLTSDIRIFRSLIFILSTRKNVRYAFVLLCSNPDAESVRGRHHGQLWVPDQRLLYPGATSLGRVCKDMGRVRPCCLVSGKQLLYMQRHTHAYKVSSVQYTDSNTDIDRHIERWTHTLRWSHTTRSANDKCICTCLKVSCWMLSNS